jgi:hypothetical protein
VVFGQEISVNIRLISKDYGEIKTRLHALPIQNKIGRLVFYLGILAKIDPETQDASASSQHQSDSAKSSSIDRIADSIEEAMQWQSSLTRARRRRLERIPFPESFVIPDPWRPDNPLVWCSPEFYRLTGNCAAEILGSNCRLL